MEFILDLISGALNLLALSRSETLFHGGCEFLVRKWTQTNNIT